MVRRSKIANVGEVDEMDPQDAVDAAMGDVVTHEGNPGGSTGEAGDEGETEQDLADQEAAGVADKPTRPASNGAAPAAGDNKRENVSPKMQYNALKRTVLALGAQHGAGKTSMIALAEAVVEAAQDGAINDQQVPEIYDKFREGVTAKSTYEDAGVVPDEAAMERIPTTDKSRDQQLSKLRQFVYLGNKYETDALDVIRKARNMHIDLLRQAAASTEAKSGVKPGSTYSILVDVARAQLKKQKEAIEAGRKSGVKHTGLAPVLTTDELNDLMTVEVKETAPMTGEEKLLAAYITAKAAEKGGKERNPVPSDELSNAIQWLRAALAVTAPELLKEHEDSIAQAAADKQQAEADKAERERIKAEKAAQPKLSKAERQAALAAAPADAAA
jgi:hypothetical protein